MKAYLLFPDRDLDAAGELQPTEQNLIQDLELETLFAAMANGDDFLHDVARQVVLTGLDEPETIRYRQQILADCLEHPSIVQQLYDTSLDAVRSERKAWFGLLFRDSPRAILQRAVEILKFLVTDLEQLRQVARAHAAEFRSAGFARFFAMLEDELDDEYLQTIREHLKELGLRQGVLMSAELGTGNKGVRHVLHRPPHLSWWDRVTGRGPAGYSFQIHERDEAGARALTDLQDRGINLVANALAQSADHVLSFFQMLRTELAFYLGCVHLHQRLAEKGEPVTFPEPLPAGEPVLSARAVYDVSLALTVDGSVVGNDVDAEGATLVMITGANQGGKSTFLRSVGLAQLMMEAGMFGPAESLRASVTRGVFTHFKREEDATMTHGKLDEELARMSGIADRIGPGSMLLCNESFGSTNEREGSELARQVVAALTESGVRVLYVTHLYDLGHSLYRRCLDTALFLRAERRDDGSRTFRMVEGEPLPTSYGADSYRRIFEASPA